MFGMGMPDKLYSVTVFDRDKELLSVGDIKKTGKAPKAAPSLSFFIFYRLIQSPLSLE